MANDDAFRTVAARGRRGGRRAVLADAAARGPAQGHGLPGRRHREHGRADGRRPGRRPVPAGVRRARASPGRTWTSPVRRSTRAARSATPPRAAPAPPCAPWCGWPSDRRRRPRLTPPPWPGLCACRRARPRTRGRATDVAARRRRSAAARRSTSRVTVRAQGLDVCHTAAPRLVAVDKCEDGCLGRTGPPPQGRRKSGRTPAAARSPETGAGAPCMEDVTWRTTPAPFST